MTPPTPTPPTQTDLAEVRRLLDDLLSETADASTCSRDAPDGCGIDHVARTAAAQAALLSSVSALAERAAAAERERDAQGEMAVGYRSSWLSEENKRFAAESRAAQAEADREALSTELADARNRESDHLARRIEAESSERALRDAIRALAKEYENEAERRQRDADASTRWTDRNSLSLGASFERAHAAALRALVDPVNAEKKEG